MIREQNNNPAISKHFELEIKTLQNTPRDPDKLEQLLQVKEREKEQQAHRRYKRLVTEEIEILKIVLHLVMSKKRISPSPLKLRYISWCGGRSSGLFFIGYSTLHRNNVKIPNSAFPLP
jgi:hypothetical protein